MIIAFGAFGLIVPNYRLGKMELRSLASLFEEVTVFKVSGAVFGVPKSGVPPWSLLLSKNYRDFEASSFAILVFRGT